MKIILRLSSIAATLLVFSGCNVVTPAGNFLNEELVSEVTVGDSREDVLTNYGSPSARATFNPEGRWYYIGQFARPRAFLRPLVYERRIIVVDFDQQGVVTQRQALALEDGQDISAVRRRSPTPGTGLSIWQQLIGNIGRFPS